MIVFAAIMPHPPESIIGIGRAEDKNSIKKTLAAFDDLRFGLEQSDAETIVVISPHARMEQYSFVINSASELTGSFMKFGLDEVRSYINDVEIVDKLAIYFKKTKSLHPLS
jgi:aromatic ring-opening dioxygenase LigB subunit